MALFVPLDASYAQDPKILDLDDERSELLFIRSLAYCKAHLTDGLIHRRALHQIAPFADEVHADDLAADLVRTGLWTETERGWRVTSWLKRNPASEEILTPNKGREMAHQRHHVKKGIQKEGCPFCFPAAEEPQVTAHDAVRDAQHAMPEPESVPEPEPTPLNSPLLPGVEEAPTLDAEQLDQMTNRAVGLLANLRAIGGDNPGGLARHIGENLPEHERAELRDLIAAGADPRDAAAELADPLRGLDPTTARPGIDPAAVAAAADAAKRRETATKALLATQRAEVPAPPPANLRTHLRAAPDPREVSA